MLHLELKSCSSELHRNPSKLLLILSSYFTKIGHTVFKNEHSKLKLVLECLLWFLYFFFLDTTYVYCLIILRNCLSQCRGCRMSNNTHLPSVVSVKSSGWCQWQFEPCLCKASMLLTNKRVKVSVWHYASTLGRYPQALKSVSWGHPHAGYLCGGCCCGWKLLWWDQLSLGRTHGGSWAMGEVMQVDNFVQVPLVRKKPGFCITADLGRRNINEQVLITVA